MKRNIIQSVTDYKVLTDNGKKHGSFSIEDGQEIISLATVDGQIDLYRAVALSLEAGYAIGYRTAQRHDKRGQE